MPRSSKKRRPNNEPTEPESSSSNSSSDNEDDADESMDNNPQENVQVDLEARSPIDSDRDAILYFLEQSFGNTIKKSILDLNQFTTQLITQQTCGSVFYQPLDSTMDETDDEDDEPPVLGVCSILRCDQQFNKQLQAWLLDKCSDNEQARKILQASKCVLFINERYMNIPADISLPAIRTLREEITYSIDYWIVHAKVRLHKNDSNTPYYVNGEEEIFQQHSTVSVDYYPPQDSSGEWTHRRKIMFVSSDKLDQICSDIEQKLKQ
ncbi:unnamed protein product [Rotaria socialis]|uniref:Protein BCCIP homolog n=1 Tax=Rotaria socialis TaxID=392032 RepID=A0A821G768_9BILA|nr:unnamed protein product [Rotaria socialis]CAF3455594.1 unnamed protein product [Rotaria socialis]CAF3519482.1 unnamed protein product [Rotaria socialis]CAF3607168.1 unnamed protein product [Rotaria socialis]CAF4311683.1 unnamed protein product [Rotaria socialis]